MSAYKQRTYHHRQRDDHSSDLRDDDFTQEHTPAVLTSVAGQPLTNTAASTPATTMASSSPSVTQRDVPSATTATALPHQLYLHGSTTSSGLFQSISHAGSSYHTAAEDEQQQQQEILLESDPADLEWTPIRNSASVARAKQRQQQYRERQQERTREWQTLLNQHYRPTTPTTASSQQPQQQNQQQGSLSTLSSPRVATALADSPKQGPAGVGTLNRPVSHDSSSSSSSNVHDSDRGTGEQRASRKSQRGESPLHGDTHHEIIPGLGPRAVSTLILHPSSSAKATSTTAAVPMTPSVTTEEQLSSGFSDLMASDGLESLGGGSEDLGVWSQADDEADDDDADEGEVLSFTLSTPSPIFQRHRFSFSNAASPSALPFAPPINSESTQRPPVSERSRSSSSAISIGQLPRPSFAMVSPTSNTRPNHTRPLETHTRTSSSLSEGLNNQMPHHDGSGNFVDLMDGQQLQQQQQQQHQEYQSSSQTIDLLSDLEDSSLDLDLDWESSSSHESSLLRAYHQRPLSAPYALRRRISSSEFKNVIQSIADLQHQSALLPHQSLNPLGSQSSHSHSSSSHGTGHQGVLLSPLSLSRLQWRSTPTHHPGPSQDSSRPRFTYLYSGSKRPIFNIYEDEMEDMADMMYEMPANLGWMEAFQATLMALEPCKSTPYCLEADKWHPIKVLTAHSANVDRSEGHMAAKEQHEEPMATRDNENSDSMAEDNINKKETLQQIRDNMNAATMEAMQRLQQNGRRRAAGRAAAGQHSYRAGFNDPMQVDFSPTVRAVGQDSSSLGQQRDRGLTSQSTGTSTSHRMLDSNLWAVVLSTLRRFRDHVQSNYLFEVYEEEDLGTQRSSPSTSRARLTRENLAKLRSGRTTRSTSSSVSSYSNRGGGSGVRRVNSDCGMESLRDHLYSHSTYPHRQLEPQLVG